MRITRKQERDEMPASQGKPASIPAGLRVYAVGDVHGRLDLLTTVAEMIETHEAVSPPARSVVIFLGDYIDRGPDSRGVIDFLLGWRPRGVETVFLRGNHEAMLLNALRSPDMFHMWAMNGGLATAQSYGVAFDPHISPRADASGIVRQLGAALPPIHLHFLENLPIGLEVGDYLFVHAGVRPGVPLDSQTEVDCLYIRDEFLTHRGSFGKVVVHGHTPVPSPEVLPNRIGIDTGAVFTGRLTVLCLEGETQQIFTTGGKSGHGRN
jgi:serine/threonine protein phosphatase 1